MYVLSIYLFVCCVDVDKYQIGIYGGGGSGCCVVCVRISQCPSLPVNSHIKQPPQPLHGADLQKLTMKILDFLFPNGREFPVSRSKIYVWLSGSIPPVCVWEPKAGNSTLEHTFVIWCSNIFSSFLNETMFHPMWNGGVWFGILEYKQHNLLMFIIDGNTQLWQIDGN